MTDATPVRNFVNSAYDELGHIKKYKQGHRILFPFEEEDEVAGLNWTETRDVGQQLEAASNWTLLHEDLYDSDQEEREIKNAWAREGGRGGSQALSDTVEGEGGRAASASSGAMKTGLRVFVNAYLLSKVLAIFINLWHDQGCGSTMSRIVFLKLPTQCA